MFTAAIRYFTAAALFCVAASIAPAAEAAESATILPAPAVDEPLRSASGSETAVLAGGCFWGVQAVFQHAKGVLGAVSGYAGGNRDTARYEMVSSRLTGHAESVEVRFDPSVISYGRILQIYFSVAHDPTQLNRQGPDEGPQYRSAIFALSDRQKEVAEAYIAQLDKAGVFKSPVVTKVSPLKEFYPAEAHHQDYATRHPDDMYISAYDAPKIENLKRTFPELYRQVPVLVAGVK